MARIRETRCECKACGNVWFYGKSERMKNVGNEMQNLGKGMMCCTGCAPAAFIRKRNVIDYNKCPKCGSRAISKSVVTHDV